MTTITRQCQHGTFAFSDTDNYVGRLLDLTGEYSEEEVRLLLALLPEGGVAIDVGAHIGCMTVPMARRAQFVVACEPQRVTFQHLCANVALNSLRNVVTVHAAVAERGGSIRMRQLDFDAPQNSAAVFVAEDASGETTPVVALDDLRLPRCDLLKVDAEGWDGRVIAGALRLVGGCQPVVYAEARTEPEITEIAQLLRPLEYSIYRHTPPIFGADNIRRATLAKDDPLYGVVSHNLLCMPARRAPPHGFELRALTG
jgi:FkbM family methyltransferase